MTPTLYSVAVLGATGLVGQKILSLLESRAFPVGQLKLLSSKRSAGQVVHYAGKTLTVEEATPQAFEGVQIVLASAGGSVSAALAPEAVKRGAIVIDNTSHFRMDPAVPLVIAGVNDADMDTHQGIIANPNCSTAQLMPVLNALKPFGLERVVVSTYQSVSGAGGKGIERLQAELAEPTLGTQLAQSPFKRQISHNLIAQIDAFLGEDAGAEAGYTKEETKLMHETRKILHLPHLHIAATAVRVPVLVGHSESVLVNTREKLSVAQAIKVLRDTPNVVVSAQAEDFPTPLQAEGQDPVFVGRLRQDTSNPKGPEYGLNFWVVADNLRIGAALNAVRLAEALVSRKLV